MDVLSGKVHSVETLLAGAAILSMGEPSFGDVKVDDAEPFDQGGGVVEIGGALFDYTSANHEEDYVTIDVSNPTQEQSDAIAAVLADGGGQVNLWPHAPETTALVVVDEGSPAFPARVPHGLLSSLPDGVRDDLSAESVTIEQEGTEWTVRDVHGREDRQVWGDPSGVAVELDPHGLTLFDVDDDGVRYPSTSLGGEGEDEFWLTDETGEKIAGIGGDGQIVGSSGAFAGDLTLGGTPLLGTLADSGEDGWLDMLPWGVIARQVFNITQGPYSPDQEWGYASIGTTFLPGRVYRLGATMRVRPANVTGFVRCRIRLATGGSSVSITSPEEATFEVASPNAFVYHTAHLEGFAGVTSTQDVQMLVTLEGRSGATPSVSSAELWIEDVGPSGSYGGGSYNTGGQTSGGGGGGTPTPTTRLYTSTWRASDSATYKGDGSQRTTSDASGDVIQGYNSYNGNQKGVWYFGSTAVSGETSKTMGQALSGATVKKVEIYVYANHTYLGAGATVNLRRASGQWLPATWGGVNLTGNSKSFSIKSGQGRWVRVDNVWADARLFTVSTGSTSGANYVRLNGHTDSPSWTRPAIRVTYER